MESFVQKRLSVAKVEVINQSVSCGFAALTREAFSVGMINLGGPNPDGTRTRDMLVDGTEFVCSSAAELGSTGSIFKFGQMGRLCLTTSALVMLPYEGTVLKAVQKLAGKLQSTILGDYAQLADAFQQLGLYPKGPQVLTDVLVWPLTQLDGPAEAKNTIGWGAQFIISKDGEQYYFNMSAEGSAPSGQASAQEFRDNVNSLCGF